MEALKLPADERGFVEDQVRDRFFQTLRSLPDNRSCFDCASRNNAWISTTFGIFLCVTCSGQHRNLGARVSFVRSTDLDRIKVEELVRMELGGNQRARLFFREHALQEGRPTDYRVKVCDRYRKQLDKEVLDMLSKHRPELIPKPPEANNNAEDSTTSTAVSIEAALNMSPAVSPSLSMESVVKKPSSSYKPTSSANASSHFYGSTPAPSKGSLKAKTVDFDFDFDSAFESGAAVPSYPSPSSQENCHVDAKALNKRDEPFFAELNLPKTTKDLRNAKAICATDFEPACSQARDPGHYNKFRDAQAISSEAFFAGGEVGSMPDMSFEDEASTRIAMYSDKAVQKATDLAVAASETLRNAANWFGKVSSSTGTS